MTGNWEVYVDGSVFNNGTELAYGGYGICAVVDSAVVLLAGGHISPRCTNNIAELTALMTALRLAPASAVFYSDSQYVVQGLNSWCEGWERRGWTTGEGKPVSNSGLWKKLLHQYRSQPRRVEWLRGHDRNPGNEVADYVAHYHGTHQRQSQRCLRESPWPLESLFQSLPRQRKRSLELVGQWFAEPS